MGKLEYHCINTCIRCKGHRMCPLLRDEVKEVVARLNKMAQHMGEEVPNASIVIDCADFDPFNRSEL